jgi:hypothetical protein
MKYFFVFGWDKYYPYGGMNDFKKSFETFEEAEKWLDDFKKDDQYRNDRYEIIDIREYIVG